jgi:hypothetical protein
MSLVTSLRQADARDYEIRIWYSAETGDECFVAQVVESSQREQSEMDKRSAAESRGGGTPSQWCIMAHGDTREEAARQIQLALDGALQVAAQRGIKPPAPAVAHAQ